MASLFFEFPSFRCLASALVVCLFSSFPIPISIQLRMQALSAIRTAWSTLTLCGRMGTKRCPTGLSQLQLSNGMQLVNHCCMYVQLVPYSSE
jgi:hypothetical protein